jgi:hypothetical protein
MRDCPFTVPSWEQDNRAARCVQCGSPLAHDQRYCVECGTRRGPLPRAVARQIDAIGAQSPRLAAAAGAGAGAGAEAAGAAPGAPGGIVRPGLAAAGGWGLERGRGAAGGWSAARGWGVAGGWPHVLWPAGSFVPRPQAAAVAVLACLGFGVVLGAGVKGSSVSPSPVLVADVPAPAAASTPPATVEPPAGEPATTPEVSTGAVTPKPAASKPATTTTETTKTQAPSAPSNPLPPVKHVFEIVLSEHGFEEAFGASSQATYLAKTLASQGELLTNYYAVAQGSLANEIALISGQGPTPQTDEDCPLFSDIVPGTVGAEGQVAGSGCVYPAAAPTIADELTSAHKSWKAYVEGIGSGAAGEASTCRHPVLGSSDPDQLATATDPYVTWRNPFVYFHSLIDGTACAKQDVGLEELAPDLKTAAKTPSLSYIVPDRCEDGSEQPCKPGAPAGLAAADTFLQSVVPQIESSPAYKQGGLIAITFDEAPQSGPNADQSACCEIPKYPNLAGLTTTTTTTASAGTSAATSTTVTTTTTGSVLGGETSPTGGGGRVGLLLISPYVKPGSVSEVYYDHFSLLLSIEELFSVKRLGYTMNPALVSFGRPIYNGAAASG